MNDNKLSTAEYLKVAHRDLQWNHQNKVHNSQYYFQYYLPVLLHKMDFF